ncbi:hypothetical protein M501DRAFT_1013727 [Patellaria atrata CBS 101060]|uniref:Methyltransferase n=1 Tax=Patellaria atrata CBS 101060 TaxID=1346257 RepID=A0A9P4VST8_9PEZI|nr:hypothetical protein M501DRAFT_1013727 [Patellaria atrata CBS 101060]
MTTATFHHIDTTSYTGKPWSKVDGPGTSFLQTAHTRPVTNIRPTPHLYTTTNAGFQLLSSPSASDPSSFTSDTHVRGPYYTEIENLLRDSHPGISKVVIFDHTIRRRNKDAPRQPVQQVHVDQSPSAAAARVRRHLPPQEAEEVLRSGRRFQIVNVWRPIAHAASDFPLAVVDWRSTSPSDFVPVDLLYPTRADSVHDDDDRGKEILPDPESVTSTAGYEVKGETLAVAANDAHRFCYVKDMRPDEVMLLKCFDSWGEGLPGGREGVAVRTPHTAFMDPQTPKDAPGRQSIEVRCLVFYEE